MTGADARRTQPERPGAAQWVPEGADVPRLREAAQARRGRLLDWPDRLPAAHPPAWVLPTTHPAAVLRSRSRHEDLAALVADLRVAAAAL